MSKGVTLYQFNCPYMETNITGVPKMQSKKLTQQLFETSISLFLSIFLATKLDSASETVLLSGR